MELSHKVKMSMPAKFMGPMEGTVDFFRELLSGDPPKLLYP